MCYALKLLPLALVSVSAVESAKFLSKTQVRGQSDGWIKPGKELEETVSNVAKTEIAQPAFEQEVKQEAFEKPEEMDFAKEVKQEESRGAFDWLTGGQKKDNAAKTENVAFEKQVLDVAAIDAGEGKLPDVGVPSYLEPLYTSKHHFKDGGYNHANWAPEQKVEIPGFGTVAAIPGGGKGANPFGGGAKGFGGGGGGKGFGGGGGFFR